jgi:spore coat protein U-like protein
MRCTVTSTGAVAFGAYDTLDTVPLDSSGFVAVECTGVGPSDMMRIELGRGRGNSYVPRSMHRRRFRLEYNLFMDAARTVVWGDGRSGTSAYQGRPPSGSTLSIPIFGRIPARQAVEPGPYNDVINVTVLY